MTKHTETAGQYPVIPLRTEVQLPGHVGPLEIGREASVRAIEAATRDDNLIVILPQKTPAVRAPGQRDDLSTLLIETDTMKRLERIIPSLERQATVLRLKADIGAELEGESSRTHRERVLRDRMRQIQEELGEQDDNAEIDDLRKKIEDSKMSDEVRAVAKKQLSRMSQMASSSPEYNIARTYVENLLEIPWNVYTEDRARRRHVE